MNLYAQMFYARYNTVFSGVVNWFLCNPKYQKFSQDILNIG